MANAQESMLKILTQAKNGDENALQQLKALRKAQRDNQRRVEELRMTLLQLTEKHWEQSISIIKGWLKKDTE